MTPSEQPVRRPRRAVRQAGTVGGDDAHLVSTLPAVTTQAPVPPAAPRTEPVVAPRSPDDSDVGWGDSGAGSNDDRLRQDKPPHW